MFLECLYINLRTIFILYHDDRYRCARGGNGRGSIGIRGTDIRGSGG